MLTFRDRADAGRKLALELRGYATEDPIILALPRGGVAVGYEVARGLPAPLDVWVVRKVGAPWHPELGVGAVAEGGYAYLSDAVLAHTGLSKEELAALMQSKREEVQEYVRKFRAGRPPPLLHDRTVIVVDDGIATGGTVLAAIRSIRTHLPKRIVVAVPVVARQSLDLLVSEVDRVVSLLAPDDLYAIGTWYEDFSEVSDAQIVRFLEDATPPAEVA